jgi:hypothetical protein
MFEKDLVVEECMKLDTRLVRDWHVRENQWCRRARLVGREFRDGDASSYETFSPTTPVAVVKMLIVMSLYMALPLHQLMLEMLFFKSHKLLWCSLKFLCGRCVQVIVEKENNFGY